MDVDALALNTLLWDLCFVRNTLAEFLRGLVAVDNASLTIEEWLSLNLVVFAALTDIRVKLAGFWDNGAFLKLFVVIVVVILAVQRNVVTAALLLAAAFLLALAAVLVILALVVSVAALNEAVSSDNTLLTESAISPFLLWVLTVADLASGTAIEETATNLTAASSGSILLIALP